MARKATPARRRPSVLGSVEPLPSGRFRAFYRIDGTKFTAPHTFPDRKSADGWLATERADRLRGTWRDPRQGQTTLSEYLAGWLDSSRNLSPRTRELYAVTARLWIVPAVGTGRPVELGSLTLAQLSPAVVRRWFAAVSDAARAAAERRAARRSTRQHPARSWALSRGLTVSGTGRLSPAVLDAWQAAGSPMPELPPVLAEPGRTTAAQAYRLLRTVLNAAVRDGLMASNPCTIPGAGTVRHRERGTANPAEVVALAHAMPERHRAAVIVAAWSSLRYGELFALARRHVDLTAGTLRVERALPRHGDGTSWALTKTAGSARTVTLPPFVVDELRAHLDTFTGPEPDALVFATASGRPINSGNLHAMFARARASIGRDDLTWHDLRHTGATLAYRAGASVKDVQRRLGHTTARAAMIYAHAADDSDRLIAVALGELYAADSNVRPFLPRTSSPTSTESAARHA
jgi:integrase